MTMAREKMHEDLEYIKKAMIATHGPMHQVIGNLTSMMQAIDTQFEILLLITQRNTETLLSFITEFLEE